ncbi:unnamed protein product [Pleuronectes platessa]|uniref:Uncharacterized protein n=1 Tax=Pleuronectes platessa TaxID=8262 RepID=A0A9N7YPI8_PLEPL|nr:uncharacterized protein LOC128445913 isoform X1 [Pleuronectes platessa]CAB1432766.1 unnamed protein product [Pleuronectes platessa]
MRNTHTDEGHTQQIERSTPSRRGTHIQQRDTPPLAKLSAFSSRYLSHSSSALQQKQDTAYIVLLAMEGPEPTTRATATGQDGNHEADQELLMTSKPLHRFITKEPKVLGIVILICGCAELLMGFHLVSESVQNSCAIYIPFWQGILFLVCGKLSIYTEIHPSKKMVTVCLAMYVVSILGAVISIGFRMYYLSYQSYLKYMTRRADDNWARGRMEQLLGVEGLLFTSSLCVAGILIFLSSVARLALKSTNTQVIVRCIPAPAQSDATPN